VTDSNGLTSNALTSNVVVSILDGVEGAFVVYDIRNNTVISVQNLFQAGFQWTVAGFGNFSGNANETDMILRNTATSGPNAGEWHVYDISKNIVYTSFPLLVNYLEARQPRRSGRLPDSAISAAMSPTISPKAT
jgi:hypothetical protein